MYIKLQLWDIWNCVITAQFVDKNIAIKGNLAKLLIFQDRTIMLLNAKCKKDGYTFLIIAITPAAINIRYASLNDGANVSSVKQDMIWMLCEHHIIYST